jgi:multiple sugar transport system permease protein
MRKRQGMVAACHHLRINSPPPPMQTLKIAGLAACLLTLLWLLSPTRSMPAPEAGVTEITYMQESGLFTDAIGDAIRAFEQESREAHARDPSRPIYRVVSGQNASRDETEDPTRFLVSVAGGTPPDLIRFDRYAVTEWAARGAFTRLDGYLARDAAAGGADALRAEDFYKSCWDEVVYRNPATGETGVYGIPEKLDDRMLYYNKDLLKRAGYVDERGEARPPRTWEELEQMAIKLTERDANGRITRLGFAPNFGNAWLYMYGFLNGGRFMSADGRECTLNEPRIVQALAWMTRIYDELGGAEAVSAFESQASSNDLDPFVLGRVAMKIDGFWVLDTLTQYGQGLNYGIALPPMPAAELAAGRKPRSWVSGFSHAIPSTARHKEGAWELLRFLCTQRAQKIIAESTRVAYESQGRTFIPQQNSIRRINEWLFDTYVYGNPRLPPKVADGVRLFNDVIDDSPYRPVTAVGQLLWNTQRDETEMAIRHKATPQEALDRGTAVVQRELDQVLSPARGRVIDFRWLGGIYIVLLIGVAALVYRWDTSREMRATGGRMLDRVGLGRLAGGGVEGTVSPLFRAQWAGGLICALPWIVGFVVFTGGPIFFSIIMSFCDYDVLNAPRLVGLDNYGWMFLHDPLFWKSMWNTVYMMVGIPLGMALSLGIAVLLNQQIRGVAVWRTLFYLPSIMPAVAASILWIWILKPDAGLLNTLLDSVGIHGPNWLQDEHTSKLGLLMMGLWACGGGMIVWLAGLKGISDSYYEAAALDGANAWQQFWHVTIPLLSPYILFNLVMGLIGTFQIFTQAFVMTSGGPVNSTTFYAYYLFNQAFRYLHMGYACALGWVLFVIVFVLTMIQMRLSERWVHYEA